MLPILLLILKIIGIAVLALLGLAVVILLLVLVVPVRYALAGSFDGNVRLQARITWLLHAVSVTGTYGDGLDMAVKILGIRLFQKKEAGDERPVDLDTEEEDREEERDLLKTGPDPDREQTAEEETEDREDPVSHDETELCEEDLWPEEETPGEKGKRRKKDGPFFSGIADSVRKTAGSVRGQWEKLWEFKEKAAAFLTDGENQKTLKLIFCQLRAMICHILPGKVKGKVTFGTEDPAFMGQVLAILSVVYTWYGDSVEITPVFDEKILEAEGRIKGRLRAGTLLVLALRILLNKNFRLLVRRWRRSGGK